MQLYLSQRMALTVSSKSNNYGKVQLYPRRRQIYVCLSSTGAICNCFVHAMLRDSNDCCCNYLCNVTELQRIDCMERFLSLKLNTNRSGLRVCSLSYYKTFRRRIFFENQSQKHHIVFRIGTSTKLPPPFRIYLIDPWQRQGHGK